MICLSRFWFLSRFCLKTEGRRKKNLDPYKCECKHIALKKISSFRQNLEWRKFSDNIMKTEESDDGNFNNDFEIKLKPTKYLFDTHELLNFDKALTSCSSSFSRILIKPKWSLPPKWSANRRSLSCLPRYIGRGVINGKAGKHLPYTNFETTAIL